MTRLLSVVLLVAGGCTAQPGGIMQRAPVGSVSSDRPEDDPIDPEDDDPADPVDDPADPVDDPEDPVDEPEDEGCDPGVICVTSLPFTDSNTTTGGATALDGYSCSPSTDESGPEVVYQVELTETGLLVASLSNLGVGVDVDVHLLQELDSGACIDRGHWDSLSLLEPGTYYVAVDSWVDGSGDSQDGDYDLRLQHITADDYASEGLDPSVMSLAARAFDRAWADGDAWELEYGIVDYTVPSTEPRFWVIDLRNGDLLYSLHTTHGIGGQDPNDLTRMDHASNVNGSNTSSVGLVRTAETYWGSNGYSLRLDGLESGFNNNDRTRAIVIHGADYAEESFANANGYLGRSWGCPAVGYSVPHDEFIDTLADGRLVLKYFDDADWLSDSYYVAP